MKHKSGCAMAFYGNKLFFVILCMLLFHSCAPDNTSPTGTVSSINCSSTSVHGTLTLGVSASGVYFSISYNGGNGGVFSSQSINSTGVTGLKAMLPNGSFANGNGILTYSISGIPDSSGVANFAISIGGQNCFISLTINSSNSTGTTVSTCGADSVVNANLVYGLMLDQDGNSYKTIKIGAQEWMAENLHTNHFQNGDPIPLVIDDSTWSSLTSSAFCHVFNDSVLYHCPNGKLYNGYAVVDARKLCPIGWHVSTNSDWNILAKYLDISADTLQIDGWQSKIAGGMLKSSGTQYWYVSTSASNSAGFSGLPAGQRNDFGLYGSSIGTFGDWWTSTIKGSTSYALFFRTLFCSDAELRVTGTGKKSGKSVRCVKD